MFALLTCCSAKCAEDHWIWDGRRLCECYVVTNQPWLRW